MSYLDLAEYAVPAGGLALGIVFFLCWRGAAAARKGRSRLDAFQYFSPLEPVFSGKPFATAALFLAGLFFVLLFSQESKLVSVALLTGAVSAALLVLSMPGVDRMHRASAFGTGEGAGSDPAKSVPRASLSGLLAIGLGLAGIGMFFHLWTWGEAPVIGGYALGVCFALFFAARRRGQGDLTIHRPIAPADLYASYTTVLAAAVAMGAGMDEHHRIWSAIPFLAAMAGLAASLGALFFSRLLQGIKGLNLPRLATAVSGVIYLGMVFFIVSSMTQRMTTNALALSGMLDRFGPFCAVLTGWGTGILIFASARRYNRVDPTRGTGSFGAVFFPLYFAVLGVWMAYLFAEFYGIALAGIGLLGTLGMDDSGPALRETGKEAPGEEALPLSLRDESGGVERPSSAPGMTGFGIIVSLFAALAAFGAYLSVIRNTEGLEYTLADLAGLDAAAGFAVGGIMIFLARFRDQRPRVLAGFGNHLAAGLSILLVPGVMGALLGPAALGGVLLGTILPGFFIGFRKKAAEKGVPSGFVPLVMQLTALVAWVFAPLVLFLYRAIH